MDSREPAVSIDEVGVGHNRDILGDALTRHKSSCPVGVYKDIFNMAKNMK